MANLTAELVLEALAAAKADSEGYVHSFALHAELKRLVLDSEELAINQWDEWDEQSTQLLVRLREQNYIKRKIVGLDLYDRDFYYRLTKAGRKQATEAARAAKATPALAGAPDIRQRISSLAERASA
jgi:hypothetical protein